MHWQNQQIIHTLITSTNVRINKRNYRQHLPDNIPQGVEERIGRQHIFSFSEGRSENIGNLRNELARGVRCFKIPNLLKIHHK